MLKSNNRSLGLLRMLVDISFLIVYLHKVRSLVHICDIIYHWFVNQLFYQDILCDVEIVLLKCTENNILFILG